jgi:ElaB/YqjD/DUF883 family membrane-anchored ribosome-binding protein
MESATDRGMTGTSNMNDEYEQLKSGLSQLRADVVELFNHAFGLGRGGAEYARDSASDAMQNLKDKFADYRNRGADQVAEFSKKIEENPMTSAMIAFGVGFLVAKMMHRRH